MYLLPKSDIEVIFKEKLEDKSMSTIDFDKCFYEEDSKDAFDHIQEKNTKDSLQRLFNNHTVKAVFINQPDDIYIYQRVYAYYKTSEGLKLVKRVSGVSVVSNNSFQSVLMYQDGLLKTGIYYGRSKESRAYIANKKLTVTTDSIF